MKTLKITDETHKKLAEIKATKGDKTLDQTIKWLINYFYYTPLKGDYKFNDK